MTLPVYILIRTSGRPRFFARMMETIKTQTYNNIVTIVHSDDPRDEYVTGDIIIRGTAYGLEYGDGSYNLYNNRLLKAIPDGPGWIHFIDDDDEYATPDVLERFVRTSKPDHINVARVQRWGGSIWPRQWKIQKSYQTECFLLHTDHKHKANWWGNRGGDHHYSKQLTRILPINWIEKLLVCKAQEGKGHGHKLDLGGVKIDYSAAFPAEKEVAVLGLTKYQGETKEEAIKQSEIKYMRYELAFKLERKKIVKITHWGTISERKPVRQIYNF